MRLVIFGGRTITDMAEVEKAMEEWGRLAEVTEIVSGAAAGVDTLAVEYAEKHGLHCELFPADWVRYKRKAGPIRNEQMARYADFGVAVWDGKSRGTGHMIGLMEGRVFVRIVGETAV
ncbi:MAG: DUF2493 domain-containing protein [Deltaproteobacteria bacterium]|jgi:hypothetical protein|nr:DUF2493 domain-containing protein [Deltaproteobacteria bacterium]